MTELGPTAKRRLSLRFLPWRVKGLIRLYTSLLRRCCCHISIATLDHSWFPWRFLLFGEHHLSLQVDWWLSNHWHYLELLRGIEVGSVIICTRFIILFLLQMLLVW